MKIRRLAVVLTTILLLTVLFSTVAMAVETVASGTCGENLTWTLDSEGTLTISGSGSIETIWNEIDAWHAYEKNLISVVIEEGVTEVGGYEFSNCPNLKSVTIPNSVTKIGDYAFFRCYALEKVILPSGLKKIDNYTFAFCERLQSIIIPESVSVIGKWAFGNSGLTAVDIPESVTCIDRYAFCETMLTSVTLPSGLTSSEMFDINAFSGCKQLTEIKVNENNQWLHSDSRGVLYAGQECIWAPSTLSGSYEIAEGTEVIGRAAFSDCTELTEVIIPESTCIIEYGAFNNCRSLTSLELPSSITEIGGSIISGCSSLKEIFIPASVENMSSGALAGCEGLEKIVVADNNELYCSDERGVMLDKSKTELIQVPGGYVGDYSIPDGVTQICENAFDGCGKITSITIPESVEDEYFFGVYNGVFDGNTSLVAIWVDEGNPIYSSDAAGIVYNKTKTVLVKVPESYSGDLHIPDTVRVIETGAFQECSKIKNIHIPASVGAEYEEYDEYIGFGLEGLQGIWVDENNPTYSNDKAGALLDKTGSVLLDVPGGLEGEYRIPDSVESIEYSAFRACTSLTKIVLPSIQEIYITTFENCEELDSLVFIGDAPMLYWYEAVEPFIRHQITIYYPASNETWDETAKEQFGDNITWVAMYSILEGGDNVIDLSGNTSLDIRVDAEISEFEYLMVDRTVIDPENYTVKSGSTIVSLCADYLKTLENGEHSVRIVFRNGVAETRFELCCTHAEKTEVEEKLPSCTEAGNKAHYVCEACGCVFKADGETLTTTDAEKILAAGHVEKVNAAKEPSCTESGVTEGVQCSVCGEILIAQESIPALGHSWDEGVVTLEPTEEAEGMKTYACERCGETRAETIPVLQHTHSYGKVTTKPTCTERGYTTHVCACGESYVDSYVEPLGHGFGDWKQTKPATEEAEGEEERSCAACGKVEKRSIPKLEPEKPENPFADVPEGKYFTAPVLWAVEQGITTGVTDTTFEPGTVCNRQQIVMFLWRAAGSPEPETMESPFTDVTLGSKFIKPILWAVDQGITQGTGNGDTFSPKAECTRQQIVMFLWRSYGQPEPQATESPFGDVTSGSSFFKAIMWAVEKGITKGTGDGSTFSPKNPCTRGQIVTFLYRAMAEE